MPALACPRHPDKEATGTCFDCLRPVCAACATPDGLRSLCDACVARARQRRRSARALLVAIVVAAVGGLVALRFAFGPGFEYGAHAAGVKEARARLERAPCDRAAMLRFGEAMARAGDYRGVLGRSEQFAARCGPWPLLRGLTYEAHKRLGEWDAAIADATALIDDRPEDKDFWWWRGAVHEAKGDLGSAAADYRQALLVEPRLTNIPFNLASVCERMGRPCDAADAIEAYLHQYPKQRDEPRIERRLTKLRKAGDCYQRAKWIGEVRFERGAMTVIAPAHVGGAEGWFVVDATAPLVLVRGALAERAGLRPGAETWVRTAAGVRRARATTVPRIGLGGAWTTDVPAGVLDALPEGIDGVLGASMLVRFEVVTDRRCGVLQVQPHGEIIGRIDPALLKASSPWPSPVRRVLAVGAGREPGWRRVRLLLHWEEGIDLDDVELIEPGTRCPLDAVLGDVEACDAPGRKLANQNADSEWVCFDVQVPASDAAFEVSYWGDYWGVVDVNGRSVAPSPPPSPRE